MYLSLKNCKNLNFFKYLDGKKEMIIAKELRKYYSSGLVIWHENEEQHKKLIKKKKILVAINNSLSVSGMGGMAESSSIVDLVIEYVKKME